MSRSFFQCFLRVNQYLISPHGEFKYISTCIYHGYVQFFFQDLNDCVWIMNNDARKLNINVVIVLRRMIRLRWSFRTLEIMGTGREDRQILATVVLSSCYGQTAFSHSSCNTVYRALRDGHRRWGCQGSLACSWCWSAWSQQSEKHLCFLQLVVFFSPFFPPQCTRGFISAIAKVCIEENKGWNRSF